MSRQPNDGGPAYPRSGFVSEMAGEALHYDSKPQAGMSLRDYFAGQALAGFASESKAISSASPYTLARGAYSVAEAMMDVRKEGGAE